jgi:hypothetical protein
VSLRVTMAVKGYEVLGLCFHCGRAVMATEEHLLVQHPGEYELVPFGVIHVECPIDHLPWHKRIVERARRWWKS